MLNIYEEQLEKPKAQIVINMQQVVMEVCDTSMHTISIGILHNEQRQDIKYKKLVSQICHGYFVSKLYLTKTLICSLFAACHNHSTTFLSSNHPA